MAAISVAESPTLRTHFAGHGEQLRAMGMRVKTERHPQKETQDVFAQAVLTLGELLHAGIGIAVCVPL